MIGGPALLLQHVRICVFSYENLMSHLCVNSLVHYPIWILDGTPLANNGYSGVGYCASAEASCR